MKNVRTTMLALLIAAGAISTSAIAQDTDWSLPTSGVPRVPKGTIACATASDEGDAVSAGVTRNDLDLAEWLRQHDMECEIFPTDTLIRPISEGTSSDSYGDFLVEVEIDGLWKRRWVLMSSIVDKIIRDPKKHTCRASNEHMRPPSFECEY